MCWCQDYRRRSLSRSKVTWSQLQLKCHTQWVWTELNHQKHYIASICQIQTYTLIYSIFCPFSWPQNRLWKVVITKLELRGEFGKRSTGCQPACRGEIVFPFRTITVGANHGSRTFTTSIHLCFCTTFVSIRDVIQYEHVYQRLGCRVISLVSC